jgi:bacteriorhodopsin
MNIWDPFHPVAYFLHAVLGVTGILAAIVALTAVKGSRRHVLAGRTFAMAAAVAAATAIGFSFRNFAPMAIASAVLVLAAVFGAVLALRRRSPSVAVGELMASILLAIATLWLIFGAVIAITQGGLLWIPPSMFALLPVVLLINDFRFSRLDDAGRAAKRLRRHLSRMAFALAITVHSPVVIFADDLHLHPAAAFYAPFLIWPAIYFFFDDRIRKKRLELANA